jgi:hypothetical protein
MKNPFSLKHTLLLIGSCMFILALYSCSKNDNNNNQPDVAGLMAFNLSPDKPLIGISLSGNTLRPPLPYVSYTGGYVSIYPGERSTVAFDAGSGNSFASTTYKYLPRKYYSVFVTGANGTYNNIVVSDNIDSLSGISGESYIRYINAVTDSSKPQVMISDSQSVVVNDQPAFKDVSSFTQIKSGPVTIAINNGAKINASRNITLEEQKLYTILFVGNPSGTAPGDSVQIRYIENGKLKLDTSQVSAKVIN